MEFKIWIISNRAVHFRQEIKLNFAKKVVNPFMVSILYIQDYLGIRMKMNIKKLSKHLWVDGTYAKPSIWNFKSRKLFSHDCRIYAYSEQL